MMLAFIDNSSGALPIGYPQGSRLFMLTDGIYSGRMIAIYRSSASEIKYCYADYPYREWSNPSLIVSGTADEPFDAVLLQNKYIIMVYTRASDNALVTTRLNYISGAWVVHSVVVVHDQDENYNPALIETAEGEISIVWSRLTGGNYYVSTKESSDGGATYGSLTDLSTAATEAFPSIVSGGGFVYVFYELNGNSLRYRRKELGEAGFEAEVTLVSSSGLDHHFDSAMSPDGRISLAFDNGQLRFMEFDGVSWSGIVTVSSNGGRYPQTAYYDNVPCVVFLDDLGSGRVNMKYSLRSGLNFSPPRALESGRDFFAKVLLYDFSAGSYEDLTVAASNDTVGDIHHSDSSAILAQSGDSCYLGMNDRFHFARFRLSTTGTGGTVLWSYFNGRDWINFVPSGGAWHFSESDKSLLLWNDDRAVPDDWQKSSVNGSTMYWIKVSVATPFTTPPVGSQIDGIGNGTALILME